MNRVNPDIIAEATRARLPQMPQARAAATSSANPPQAEGAAGETSTQTLRSTTAEFQADGAP